MMYMPEYFFSHILSLAIGLGTRCTIALSSLYYFCGVQYAIHTMYVIDLGKK